MSVNSKMTAIADKIRSLLGLTGIMGLDAMATNLGTVQANVINAFTAIGNKGGTVPTSQVSGNLASAIASIPSGGATVRRAEGTFQVVYDTFVTVDVGFKPDVVMLYFEGYGNSTTINFAESDKLTGEYQGMIYISGATPYFLSDFYPNANDVGFGIIMLVLNYDFEYVENFEPFTINYVAIKYT